MGYDHQNDSDADAMEELESAILARLRMPNPYLARG
jgi:ssRNA-specific RNase YbeY (16S rRNA maturation enzyme)